MVELKQTAKGTAVNIHDKTDFVHEAAPVLNAPEFRQIDFSRRKNGRRGERAGVCACVWSPEYHRAVHQLPQIIPNSSTWA